MKKYTIAVCIPTFNEEDSIRNVTQIVDNGLHSYFPSEKALILNVDSNSTDSTREQFKETQTISDKLSVLGNGEIKGKGSNLFTFLEYSNRHDVDFLCTIDGDLTSVEPVWIKHLLEDIVNDKADYIVPLYTRNRYEGSATNHYCVPLLNYLFGESVRQPIGGEFAFSKNFAKYVIAEIKPPEAYKYGIDIFLTTHAIGGGFRVKEMPLGKKMHKPSFGKMVPMFEEISMTSFQLLQRYKDSKVGVRISFGSQRNAIDPQFNKPNSDSIKERQNFAIDQFENATKVKSMTPYSIRLLNSIRRKSYMVDKNEWQVVLENTFTYVQNATSLTEIDKRRILRILTALYLLRVLTFYEEIENTEITEIEEILNYQIKKD